jgi:hypothetical protein
MENNRFSIAAPETTSTALAPLKRPLGLNGLTVRWECNKLTKQTAVIMAREQGAALLAGSALQNLGALSSLEAQLTQLAPQGAERYQHIVDAYAMAAAVRMAVWA